MRKAITAKGRNIGGLLTVALAASLFGCAKPKTDPSGARDAGASASGQATIASSAPSAGSTGEVPATMAAVLRGKLQIEAQGRPTATPRAEDVLAAIEKRGVVLQDEAQHVASTIGAHYCIGAKSPAGLAMSACEYDDEAKAAAGRDLSKKAFAPIQHRDILVNKKTTLTILQNPFGEASQAAHDKAAAAFASM